MQPYHPSDLEILSMDVPKTKGAVRLRPNPWSRALAKRSFRHVMPMGQRPMVAHKRCSMIFGLPILERPRHRSVKSTRCYRVETWRQLNGIDGPNDGWKQTSGQKTQRCVGFFGVVGRMIRPPIPINSSWSRSTREAAM
jgi:hypothetical protein